MDIEDLEKLNELKEKGIITQEEFDNKKKEILKTPKNLSFSLKNMLVAFFSGILVEIVCIFALSIVHYCDPSLTSTLILVLLCFILGSIFAMLGVKYETKKYEKLMNKY